jgi:hypothetical protein
VIREQVTNKGGVITGTNLSTRTVTRGWVESNLPSDLEQGLLCVDIVICWHAIDNRTVTREQLSDDEYKTKKTGMGTKTLLLFSSFQTDLLGPLGKDGSVNSTHHLPAARSYKDWHSIEGGGGVELGIKVKIQEGMREQVELYNGLLEDVAMDYLEAVRMGRELVTRTDRFGHVLLTVVDEIMIENLSRGTKTTDTEGWIKASVVFRTVFQEFKKVCMASFSAKQLPNVTQQLGHIWWHVLQCHRFMDEFTTTKILGHPSILPVLTNHLDCYQTTKSVFEKLAKHHRNLGAVAQANSSAAACLTGRAGNQGGGGGGRRRAGGGNGNTNGGGGDQQTDEV